MKIKFVWKPLFYFKKVLLKLIMRTFILLCCTAMFAFNPKEGFSQNASIIINENGKMSVKEILKMIHKQTDYRFVYRNSLLKDSPQISLEKGTIKASDLLKKTLSSLNLTYEFTSDKTIQVKRKPVSIAPQGAILHENIQFQVAGSVTDADGVPLLGASIVEKGTDNGTQTDFDGNFSIEVADENATLLISYIGFVAQEVAINGRSTINVTLEGDTAALDEVVVVGYGSQERKDVTGSVATVSAEQLDTRPITTVEEGLQGLVPGINIAARNASPGDLSTVTIRSLGSITAGTGPLWVVDGFPTDQRTAQSLNPADIESVNILKDASSTAIYGSRGANGVIIITTKTGKSGRTSLNLNVTTGVSSVPEWNRLDVLNAEEYVQYETERNGGVVPDFIANNWDGVTDTDWQDLVFRSGLFQNYALTASGGSEKVSFLLSGNYIDQEGALIGEEQQKYSARAKIDFRPSDKVKIGINLSPNVTEIGRRSPNDTDRNDLGSIYAQAVTAAPILPVRNPDGTFAVNPQLGPGLTGIGNPLETFQNSDRTTTIFNFLGGIDASVELIDGLTAKSSFSVNISSIKTESLYQPTPGQFVPDGLSGSSFFNTQQDQTFNWLNENLLTYKKRFGEHSFDVIGGFTLQKNRTEFARAEASRLRVPDIRNVNVGDAETLRGRNGKSENALVSYLGRLNYSFMDRYLLTATVRSDGSSIFGSNNRYQTFGSFALGWRFSEESFMENVDFLDSGKLRVSFGQTGSNSIPDFASRALLGTQIQSFGGTASFGTVLDRNSPGNNNLTWELSEQLDIGLELAMFKNRVNLTFDYFNNETTSLLLRRNLVPSSGYNFFLTNIGSLRNKGVEATLNVKVIQSEDWDWTVGGNLTTNDQEILDLGGDEEIVNFFGVLKRTVGGELQQILAPRAIGIARVGDDQTGQPLQTPGAIIYEDFDGNGEISNFLGPDAQVLGDTNLDVVYGINTSLRYKNLTFSALLNGQAGGFVQDFYLTQIGVPASFRRGVNLPTFWFDGRYISEEQPGNGRIPAANGFDDANGPVSSFGVQKTDYLRIRNITLNYDFDQPFTDLLGLSSANVYFSVENLYTFTNFVGGNPDSRRTSGGATGPSQIASVTDGRELGLNVPPSLPLPTIWTVGINVNF